jgi:Cell division protein ZapA
MSELLPINIVIGDRTYRIKTTVSDEEVIRKTVKMINDKIVEFKTQFSGKDMQDYIAMVIIWFATQNSSPNESPLITQELANALIKMERQIDEVIGS